MFCCLLALALLAPVGAGAARVYGDTKDCCAGRRRNLKIAAAALCIAAVGAGVTLMLQPEPFHNICRFIASSS